jgi:hypothetical protein
VDPHEEVRRARAERQAPRLGMTEHEALVNAIVTSEEELRIATQVRNDAALAQQLEIDAVLEGAREAAAKHKQRFARRWQCALYLYDCEKLRVYCKQYDIPFASKTSAPVPWHDRVRRLFATRNHTNMDCYKDWLVIRPPYDAFTNLFRRKTGAKWKLLCNQPSLLAAQYLMTHVHLCYVQDRSDLTKIADVVKYVYGGNLSGNKKALLAEASEWLGVLVQVTMKFDVHYAFDRQAVPMILRQLLELRVDNRGTRVEFENLEPFIQGPTDASGSAKELRGFCT